ncbi:hypothetical protein [Bacteroides sedimenti]|uniref:Uncharacterized protein n=1 Tax=Bacteroides sedimenti TaxID=2136147 RepID=A0ABN6Z1Z5_9BACE
MENKSQLFVNANNKPFIDNFMERHYEKLAQKFRAHDNKINSRGNSSMDILHDTILALYRAPDNFESQKEADECIHAKFRGIAQVPKAPKLRPVEAPLI